jgi:hypothetical protein
MIVDQECGDVHVRFRYLCDLAKGCWETERHLTDGFADRSTCETHTLDIVEWPTSGHGVGPAL